MDYEVIVVGGGPAGATVAKFLGQSGVSTLVLDKSAFPREKPCGGGISARVVQRFPYVERKLPAIATHWVSKVYFESPDGSAVNYESGQPLYLMIRRVEFDHMLLSLARADIQANALVRKLSIEPDRVIVSADLDGQPRVYSSRIVIGCDGANSVIARAAGLRAGRAQSDFAIDMMEETPFDSLSPRERDRMHVYYRIQGQYGYGYVFPKSQHVNLGVGFKLDYYLSALRGRHYSYHSTFVNELKSRKLIDGDSNEQNFRAFPLPISGPLARTYCDRVLLAGDAGGFVNAFTAEGIYYAMVTGEHAGRAAANAVRAGRFDASQLCQYEQCWQHEIGLELQNSVKIQRLLLADATRIDRIVRAAARNPALAETLARYATGALSHPQFKRALIARALPFYIREKMRAAAALML